MECSKGHFANSVICSGHLFHITDVVHYVHLLALNYHNLEKVILIFSSLYTFYLTQTGRASLWTQGNEFK